MLRTSKRHSHINALVAALSCKSSAPQCASVCCIVSKKNNNSSSKKKKKKKGKGIEWAMRKFTTVSIKTTMDNVSAIYDGFYHTSRQEYIFYEISWFSDRFEKVSKENVLEWRCVTYFPWFIATTASTKESKKNSSLNYWELMNKIDKLGRRIASRFIHFQSQWWWRWFYHNALKTANDIVIFILIVFFISIFLFLSIKCKRRSWKIFV